MVDIPRLPDRTDYTDDLFGTPGWVPGPGWFLWRPDGEWPGWDIIVKCPHGHVATLSLGKHAIAPDGTVTPSIWFKGLCHAVGGIPGVPEGQEWHISGRLLGWDEANDRPRVTK